MEPIQQKLNLYVRIHLEFHNKWFKLLLFTSTPIKTEFMYPINLK